MECLLLRGVGMVSLECPAKFTCLQVTYQFSDRALAGPAEVVFDMSFHDREATSDDCARFKCQVDVQQCRSRTITITCDSPLYWSGLLVPLSQVERLLMIFDGYFVPISDICFSGPAGDSAPTGADCAIARTHAMNQRANYYRSADFMLTPSKLIKFKDVLSAELFAKWQEILDDLDIVNQVYLYAVSDNGMPRDVTLAFLVEMSESMVELLKAKRNLFPDLTPGARGTTLKDCLRALIEQYGDVVFKKEMSGDFDDCLKRLKGTRVQIMHIKRNWAEGKRFDGKHCVLYALKLSLLYRAILLDLLGIEKDDYAPKVQCITDSLDRWAEQLGS